MPQRIAVGAIAGAFGTNGEVRLKSYCADPASIADYAPLSAETNPAVEFEITIKGVIKNGFAARLSGVNTKEQADALRGTQLFADRDKLPALPDDEYYHSDLVGLVALDTGGNLLGTVKAIQNHGAGDLVEVQRPGSPETVLIPFTLTNVPTVDLSQKTMIMDPPEGVFPDD